MTIPTIQSLEALVFTLPRDVPYLGPLAAGESVNNRGYVVRSGNRTLYPTVDRSVLVMVTASDGTVGWGETYGIVAPGAVVAILDDVIAPVVAGRDARTPAVIWEDLYDLMRVRGFFGGFYVDALAGVDIALWDLAARLAGVSLATLLGGARHARIPAYLSGLPKATLAERVALAEEWVARGFRGVKYAGAVAREGVVAEMSALRSALGNDIDLMVDLHWRYTGQEAVQLCDALAPSQPYFIEAPCAPEDVTGQAFVAAHARMPVALGEELRTVYEYLPRFEARAMSIVQPEMGHTGVTQFMRIAQMAGAFHCKVIPHASVGVGIFQAASLCASATLLPCPYHEYQHSVFDRNLRFVETTMRAANGYFDVPDGLGHGVVPLPALFEHVQRPGSKG
jgi:galactonate dehydratase